MYFQKRSQFALFKQQFNQLKETNFSHIFELELFEFNDYSQKIKLKTSKLLDDLPKFLQLFELLCILRQLDFSGVSNFVIEIYEWREPISLLLINQIRLSLSLLKNLSYITVNFTHEIDEGWNADAIYLFLTYGITYCDTSFSFSALLGSQQQLQFSSNRKELTQKIEILDNSLTNIIYKPNFEYLSNILEKVLELAKEDRSNQELIDFRSRNNMNFPNQEKQINLQVFMKISQLHMQLIRIWNILLLLDLDSERISKLKIFTSDWTVPDRKEEERILDEMKQLKILKKIEMEFDIKNDVFFFSKITKLVRQVRVIMKNQSLEITNEFQGLLKEFNKENHQVGVDCNLNELVVSGITEEQIPILLRVAAFFPSLKQLHLIRNSEEKSNIINFTKETLELGSKIGLVNIDNTIQLDKSNQFLALCDRSLDSEDVLVQNVPEMINQFEKSVHFTLIINSFKYCNAIKFCRNVVGLRNVSKFVVKYSNRNRLELSEVTQARNSTYTSIIGFYKLISPFLTFNPNIILFDLYESF